MPKGDSGIRRGGGGGAVNTSNMSNEDRWAVERYQRDIEEENQRIPSFVNSRMSEEEIREALIAEVQRTGQNIGGVSPATFDNRFPDAKDSRFAPIIQGLNATRSGGENEDFYISRAEKLTQNYSTRDIRKFITEELGESLYGRGRKDYQVTLGLVLHSRFNPRGVKGISYRETLDTPDWRVIDSAVAKIQQAQARRDIYRQRIADIQAKYKGNKKK